MLKHATNLKIQLSLLIKIIRVSPKIGLRNILLNLNYKIKKRFPFSKLRTIEGVFIQGKFFKEIPPTENKMKGLFSETLLFGWKVLNKNYLPDWHRSFRDNKEYSDPSLNWHEIPLYKEGFDIKEVWEASRMDWLVTYSSNAKKGDLGAIRVLNFWLNDWMNSNPPYKGANWTCAQEASIRIINLATSALILNQVKNDSLSLISFLQVHLNRIEPSLDYSISQQNNHSTSEAAALFIGGSWLEYLGYQEASSWTEKGKRILEQQISDLITQDGVFSQYSLNYHRLMLDTCSLAELWKKRLELNPFSEIFYKKINLASEWLRVMVDSISGDGPNVGANDGAKLFAYGNSYRDYKSSVQLSSVLFSESLAYPLEDSIEILELFGLSAPDSIKQIPKSRVFSEGGFIVIRLTNAMLMFKFPKYTYRPSQSDALHIDLWIKGRNILLDGGTYSYRSEIGNYYSGQEGHNVVQFDDHDQMNKISRFLYSDWLECNYFEALENNSGSSTFSASYLDYKRCEHNRSVEIKDGCLIVKDSIEGFKKEAILRWRLEPGDWQIKGHTITNGSEEIVVTSDGPSFNISLIEGCESKYYLKKSTIPVIEIMTKEPCCITTRLTWN